MAQPVIETPRTQEQRFAMTYEEFVEWSDEDMHAEWVDGEVIVFVSPTDKHQAIITFLATLLSVFVDRFALGRVRVAPLEMRILPGRSSREPDVLFVAREHLDRLTPERLLGPADLVIEIVSESSVVRDRQDKFREYEEAGVREYWLFDSRPGREGADFYQLTPEGTYRSVPPDADGRYRAATLPGFWLRPDWLWQDPLPSTYDLLREIIP